jgi:hypothetical protein
LEFKSHLTALKRSKLSAPAKYLQDKDLLVGEILDYGCGKGDDAKHLSADGYDPYYKSTPVTKKYDTILATYVLNVIADVEERRDVVSKVRGLLKPRGCAYITVRRDIYEPMVTSRGTFQDSVVPSDGESIHLKKHGFEIYKLTN